MVVPATQLETSTSWPGQMSQVRRESPDRTRMPGDSQNVACTAKEVTMTCSHNPPCPSAGDAHCCSAHVVADHHEQGWCQLCNGVILFDDGQYIAPDGHSEYVPRMSA